MRRCNCNQYRNFTNLQAPNAVQNRHILYIPTLFDFGADLGHFSFGHFFVRFIDQIIGPRTA